MPGPTSRDRKSARKKGFPVRLNAGPVLSFVVESGLGGAVALPLSSSPALEFCATADGAGCGGALATGFTAICLVISTKKSEFMLMRIVRVTAVQSPAMSSCLDL